MLVHEKGFSLFLTFPSPSPVVVGVWLNIFSCFVWLFFRPRCSWSTRSFRNFLKRILGGWKMCHGMVASKSNTGSSLALPGHGLFRLLVIFGSFILEAQSTGKWNLYLCCREGGVYQFGNGCIFLGENWWWLMYFYTSSSTHRKNSITTCWAEQEVSELHESCILVNKCLFFILYFWFPWVFFSLHSHPFTAAGDTWGISRAWTMVLLSEILV